jgi:hypothetical protein
LPLAQTEQWAELIRTTVTSPMRPATHALQTTTPAALYLPAGHWLHAVDSVALALNWPAKHTAHRDATPPAANLPPSHCSQPAALAPLYFPAGHELHDTEPSACW